MIGEQGEHHNPEQRGDSSARAAKDAAENSEHGEGEDGGEEEEEGEEPSALEKILPQFPAARREVFLRVEAIMGLLPPFTARGSTVSGRIFWGGQEVREPCEQVMRGRFTATRRASSHHLGGAASRAKGSERLYPPEKEYHRQENRM